MDTPGMQNFPISENRFAVRVATQKYELRCPKCTFWYEAAKPPRLGYTVRYEAAKPQYEGVGGATSSMVRY